MTDATVVPCSPPTRSGSCAFSARVSARPANSGWVTSRPESTIVTGTPGPGRRDALDADLGEPPLVRLERVGRVGDGGDLVGVLALGERDGAAGAEAREGASRPSRPSRRQSRSFASISRAPAATSAALSVQADPAVRRTSMGVTGRGRGRAGDGERRRARRGRGEGGGSTGGVDILRGVREEILRNAVKASLRASVEVVRAYVGIGANLGDREATIRRAVELLAAEEGIDVVAVSSSARDGAVGSGRAARAS